MPRSKHHPAVQVAIYLLKWTLIASVAVVVLTLCGVLTAPVSDSSLPTDQERQELYQQFPELREFNP